MATNPDDEITEAEFIAVIVVGILIFALLVLQITLLIYIFCRKKRCCCFQDTEKKVSGDSHVDTSITCCPTRGRKSRGFVASDEYNLLREASIHSESETLVIPVVDEFVETRPVDPVYLKKKKEEEKEKNRQEKEKKKEAKKKEKKRKGEREDQDDVKGRGDPAIAALKLEAFLTPGIEQERQPRLDDGPLDTDPCGKEIDHPQTGGDPGTTGGDPGTTGGDPGTTGSDPGTSGPSGKRVEEPSTRVGLLATEFTLPGQLDDDAIVREDPFIKGRGRSFRRPIGQYTRDIPQNLPCFSLPPKGVIRAWEDRPDQRGDPGEKKASREDSTDEDLGYSEGSRNASTDEGGNGNRELDSNKDKDRDGCSQNNDKTQHHPDITFPGDPGTNGDVKKLKSKTKGGWKPPDGRRGSQDVAKTEGGKGWNGRDPRGHHVEGGGPGSEDKLLPGKEGEGGGDGDGDGKRKKRDQNGHRLHGRPGSGQATTTQGLGKAGPSRVIVGNDGDSGIVDLGRGDSESRTDPVVRNRNNQGGYYVDDDQYSTSDGGYKYWPDRVGRFRGMDHYDSADSEMVPDELGVEDAGFDDENHLMRTYTGSELNTTNPLWENSDVRKTERQRAVNLGRGLPSGAIVDTDEELSGDSKEASENGVQPNNAKTSKKGSGYSRQKKHPDGQKQVDRGQHEDDVIGKKTPKEKHDLSTPGVGTESGTNQPPLQLTSPRRKDDPTVGSESRTRRPTLQLRSRRREDNPIGTLPHSGDPDDPRQGTSGQGHQAPPPAAEATEENRKKMSRKRRRNRDTEMSARTLAAEDHHSWNAYMEQDNFCELPSPLTIIFFDSDEDLR